MQISIKSYSFTLRAPYGEGHQLTLAEAQALNALRAENVRNNIAKLVADAVAELLPQQRLSEGQIAQLQERISAYDSKYSFQPKHESKIRVRDPVRLETRRLAALRASEQLKYMQATEEKLDETIRELENDPAVIAEARSNVERQMAVAVRGLDELL